MRHLHLALKTRGVRIGGWVSAHKQDGGYRKCFPKLSSGILYRIPDTDLEVDVRRDAVLGPVLGELTDRRLS